MKLDIKTISVAVGLALTITGAAFTTVNKVNQIDDNTISIKAVAKRLTLQELRSLLRKALADYYFLKDQSKRYPGDAELKQKLAEAKREVDKLERMIEKLGE